MASVTVVVPNTGQPPSVATPAAANPSPVTAKTTALTVLGSDSGGEGSLTYTWLVTSGPNGVTFSANGTNASKNTTATFTQAGNYTFQVTLEDGAGLTTTSDVSVTVNQTLTKINVTPSSITLAASAMEDFSATAIDQFGNALATQPAFSWTIDPTGVGTIDPTSGIYQAPATGGGSATVRATANAISGTSSVTANPPVNQPPTVAIAASASPSPVNGKTTGLSVLGADDGGESNLTYAWSVMSGPSGVSFSGTQQTNGEKNTTATFVHAGNYVFLVTIKDSGGLSTTSTVGVTVNQTVTTISVTPASPSVPDNTTKSFSAQAFDQFGASLVTQPTFSWSLQGGGVGSIDPVSGLYTAPTSGTGAATVIAAASGVQGTTNLTTTAPANQPPTVQTAAAANPSPVTGTTTNLTVLGADDGGESNLTYSWSESSGPTGVTFGATGSNAAKSSMATFTQAGSYVLLVTIKDAGGLQTTSSVNVTVNQTITTINVTPSAADG